jgi:hypothetical protein
MKKVIKLTESDLYRIIKRVILEQQTPPSTTTITTQDPKNQNKKPKQKTKDSNWYSKEISNIVQNSIVSLLNSFIEQKLPEIGEVKNFYDLIEKYNEISRRRGKDSFFNILNPKIEELGRLIDPETSTPYKLGMDYLNNISYGRKKLKRFNDVGPYSTEWLDLENSSVKDTLWNTISKNKNIPVN